MAVTHTEGWSGPAPSQTQLPLLILTPWKNGTKPCPCGLDKNITRKMVIVLIGVIYSPWPPWRQVDLLQFGVGVGDGDVCVCVEGCGCVCGGEGGVHKRLKVVCVILCPTYCSHVHTAVLSILYLHCFTYLCKPIYCHIDAYTVHTLFILYMN